MMLETMHGWARRQAKQSGSGTNEGRVRCAVGCQRDQRDGMQVDQTGLHHLFSGAAAKPRLMHLCPLRGRAVAGGGPDRAISRNVPPAAPCD